MHIHICTNAHTYRYTRPHTANRYLYLISVVKTKFSSERVKAWQIKYGMANQIYFMTHIYDGVIDMRHKIDYGAQLREVKIFSMCYSLCSEPTGNQQDRFPRNGSRTKDHDRSLLIGCAYRLSQAET